MAKKNETTQKKISKWEAAPKSIQNLYFAMNGLFDELFDGLNSIIGPEDANNKEKALNDLLARVLDDYNELEAKHQKECGMISEYEDENTLLKESLRKQITMLNAENRESRETIELLRNYNLKQYNDYAKLESEYKEENEQLKADLEKQVAITEEIRELRDGYLTYWMEANERLGQLQTMLAAVDVTVEYEDNDGDGVGNWRVCNKLAKANEELELERYRFENELSYILDSIEAALSIQRIHLASSYDDRASYIIKKIKDDRKKYFVYESVAKSHYGLYSENHNDPETLESLKKFLMDEYKFDVIFSYTSSDDGYWTLVQRGPNVFNRKSNNFRWAFRGAMECLGMSPGAIAAEIIWTSNSKVTPTDISLKWSQRACEKFETKE